VEGRIRQAGSFCFYFDLLWVFSALSVLIWILLDLHGNAENHFNTKTQIVAHMNLLFEISGILEIKYLQPLSMGRRILISQRLLYVYYYAF